MATAEEFDHAAAVLEEVCSRLTTSLEPVRQEWSHEPITGGALRSTVELTIAATIHNLDTAIVDLAQQALEARRRAEVCRAYAAEVADYEAARADYDGRYRAWQHEAATYDASENPSGGRPAPPTFWRSYPVPSEPWIDL